MSCIFCEIIRSKKEAMTVYHTENTLCFLDRFPVSEGHTLVIPRRHVSSFLHLTETEMAELAVSAQKVSRALVSAYGLEGFNLVLNDGPLAGQGVPHVHIHVIPRMAGDNIRTPHGGFPVPEETLKRVQQKILEKI